MTVPSDGAVLDAQAAQAIAQDQALRQLLAGVEGLVVAQGPGPAAAYVCRQFVQLARRAATGTIGGSGEDRAAAAASERAAVVAWLRTEADRLQELQLAAALAVERAATAIEDGLHRPGGDP